MKDVKELKRICGDGFYAVEIPYHSPTCSAIFAAFDWYPQRHQRERRATHTDRRRLIDEVPKDKTVLGMLWACHYQDTCAASGMQNTLMNMVADAIR